MFELTKIIQELGFPVGMSLALLGMIWWMVKSLLEELQDLKNCISQLRTSIASLKIAVCCWLLQDGAKASQAINLINGDIDLCKADILSQTKSGAAAAEKSAAIPKI